MREGLYFFVGLILTALFIPWVQKVSLRMGYVDSPEGDTLKVHSVPIPHSGGIVIFSVLGLLLAFLSVFGDVAGVEALGLLLGGSMALALGIWDDLKSMPLVIRLGIQAMAGVALLLFGHRIEASPFISLPLTLFYVVGAINAVNMEDGLDGLAGGMAALSLLGFAFLSLKIGQPGGLIISLMLSGVLIGFLFYNFSPSSIFMGDSGSYFLGFILAYLAVSLTGLSHWLTFVAPILIIGMPVLDAGYAILRRIKKGVSPFAGDRSHFYDQLIQKGLSVRQTVLICWGFQALIVGLGIAIYPIAL